MIPSDHFVRFYNEVFKFLDPIGGLPDYYLEISRDQELHCLKLFWEKGLAGMKEYWDGIVKEENCVTTGSYEDDMHSGGQLICPSLSKILDCDATPCEKYCWHCPGWVQPLLTKCGFYSVYDIVDPLKPQCRSCITENRAKAEKWLADEMAGGANPECIKTNFDKADEIERNKARRHAEGWS